MKNCVPTFVLFLICGLCCACRSEVNSLPAGAVHVASEAGLSIEGFHVISEKPLVLLLESKPDLRNVISCIWKEGADSLITLPTNAGLIGISEEEGLLIMQSYEYYRQGGRYNRIEAYDLEGNCLGSMSPKLNPEWDKEIDL